MCNLLAFYFHILLMSKVDPNKRVKSAETVQATATVDTMTTVVLRTKNVEAEQTEVFVTQMLG